MQNRIEWIDCAKGITIILVIVGHSIRYYFLGETIRGLIFSFHMPLFFILSAITFSCSRDDKEFIFKTKRAAKQLLIPAFITFVMMTIYLIYSNKHNILSEPEYLKQKLYTLIYSSGGKTKLNNMGISDIGFSWFFFSFFIGRSLFDYTHLKFQDKQLFIVTCLMCVAGLYFGSTQWLPFSMDISLAVMPFFYVGYRLKNYKIDSHPYKQLLLFGAIWVITFMLGLTDLYDKTYLQLSYRKYNFFPICYITAIAGTLFVCELSNLMLKIKYVMKPFIYLGKNSLYLLCVHTVDAIWSKFWNVEGQQYITAFRRIVSDCVIFIIFMFIRHLYSIEKEKIVKTIS